MLARVERFLPRGWGDLGLQLAIWFGFAGVYQIARGAVDRNAFEAFQNGRHVIAIERGLHSLVELDLQRVILHGGSFVLAAVNWTEDELKSLKRMEQAAKAGQLLAERAKAGGIENAVFDRGGYQYHGRVKALAEGAREGGLIF